MVSDLNHLFADRIGGVNFGQSDRLYKFEKIKIAKRKAQQENPHVNLIDLGVGEPDWMAEKEVVEILYREALKWENRGYTEDGIPDFKVAASEYLDRVFGVKNINPETEIIHGIGTKSILALLPQAFINPGDVTLMTVPSYPVLGISTVTMGGKIIPLPLLAKNRFLPDFDSLTKEEKQKSKFLYINYPNNPTGAVATVDFYQRVIEFARENNLLVISDEAYAAFVFDGEMPLSFLAVEGAKDVGVAIHSLSKSFNMTGWRLAFLAGNEAIVKAFAHIKYNNNSGQFAAIQKAGSFCLRHPEITQKTAQKYSRRHDKLVPILKRAGFQVQKPKGSFFLYAKSPIGTIHGDIFRNAENFSLYLIRKNLISTVPWDDTRPHVRFSVTFVADSIAEEDAILEEIAKRLPGGEFIFNSS